MKQINSERRPSRRAYASLPTLALLAVLALSATAGAQQWTTSGNGASNISNTNTGNVGVGTTAPAHVLHVEGASTQANNFVQAFFRNTNAALPYGGVGVDGQSQSHVRFMLGGLPKWQWRVGAGTGVDDLRAFNWALGADVLTLTNGGSVGVGTSTPLSRLHVEGGAVLGSIRVSGAGMAVMNFKDTTAPVNQKLYQWRSQGGVFRMALLTDGEASEALPNILVANSAGHVGVGTAAPSTALEVGGGGTLSLSGAAGAGQGNIRFGAAANALYESNLIHLSGNSGATGITAGAAPTLGASNGPFVALRGNSYTANAGQRGILTLSAGSVANPSAGEGSIALRTGAEQVRVFVSSGATSASARRTRRRRWTWKGRSTRRVRSRVPPSARPIRTWPSGCRRCRGSRPGRSSCSTRGATTTSSPRAAPTTRRWRAWSRRSRASSSAWRARGR